MTENGKMLSFDQFKWLRDVMEAQLTIDSLNSHDQIKVDLRYFLQVSKNSLKIIFNTVGHVYAWCLTHKIVRSTHLVSNP